jgi:hypothetical protein
MFYFELIKLAFSLFKSKLPVFTLKAFIKCYYKSKALFLANCISLDNVLRPEAGVIVAILFKCIDNSSKARSA